MIRLFVLLGLIGGGAIVYLATYGMGPEAQMPPAVSQLVKFREEGYIPDPNAVTENEEVEHGIFLVPPEDEEMLEAAEAEMDMGDMDMEADDSTMEMAEGATTMNMEGDDATMEMAETDTTMEMEADDSTMEMADGAEEMDEEAIEAAMAQQMAGLLLNDEGDFDREIALDMSEWGFSDMQIDVKPGERIKFVVTNTGEIPHEFMFMSMAGMAAINYRATRADWSLLEHEALYEKSLVLPGGEFTFVAEVTKPGVWMYMCMLPYHMQMGMMGQMATEGMVMEM